jgi:hypothetical protein
MAWRPSRALRNLSRGGSTGRIFLACPSMIAVWCNPCRQSARPSTAHEGPPDAVLTRSCCHRGIPALRPRQGVAACHRRYCRDLAARHYGAQAPSERPTAAIIAARPALRAAAIGLLSVVVMATLSVMATHQIIFTVDYLSGRRGPWQPLKRSPLVHVDFWSGDLQPATLYATVGCCAGRV